jgi:hypothetical protein
MLRSITIAGLIGAAFAVLPPATRSQGVDATLERIETLQQQAPARQRAMNLARNSAVKINGGLSQYMPAACMFSTAGLEACLVETSEQGFRFRFNGGEPGWQQLGKPPTVTTDILISLDGRQVVQLNYNGPLN